MKPLEDEHISILRQNYKESKEYEEILESLSQFLEKEVLPFSEKIDKGMRIKEIREKVFSHGVASIPFTPELGGLGLPFSVYVISMEMLGFADASTALSIGIHNTVSDIISMFGNKEQKEKFVPDLISGRKIASFALTEPSSGSDARRMRTYAKKEGHKFVINGSKTYITNALESDYILLFASTEEGPSCFLIETNRDGVEVGPDMEKLGMRGSKTSEVFIKDCVASKEDLIGKEGEGFEYAKAGLNGSRIVMGSICVGISRIAYEKAVDFAKRRTAFGKNIAEFQVIREKISNMRILINASRLFCLWASRLREMGLNYYSEAAQAKVFSTESALTVCDNAIQIFGGYGYVTSDVNRHWRDARLLTIGEGTSEVLRMLVARKELKREK